MRAYLRLPISCLLLYSFAAAQYAPAATIDVPGRVPLRFALEDASYELRLPQSNGRELPPSEDKLLVLAFTLENVGDRPFNLSHLNRSAIDEDPEFGEAVYDRTTQLRLAGSMRADRGPLRPGQVRKLVTAIFVGAGSSIDALELRLPGGDAVRLPLADRIRRLPSELTDGAGTVPDMIPAASGRPLLMGPYDVVVDAIRREPIEGNEKNDQLIIPLSVTNRLEDNWRLDGSRLRAHLTDADGQRYDAKAMWKESEDTPARLDLRPDQTLVARLRFEVPKTFVPSELGVFPRLPSGRGHGYLVALGGGGMSSGPVAVDAGSATAAAVPAVGTARAGPSTTATSPEDGLTSSRTPTLEAEGTASEAVVPSATTASAGTDATADAASDASAPVFRAPTRTESLSSVDPALDPRSSSDPADDTAGSGEGTSTATTATMTPSTGTVLSSPTTDLSAAAARTESELFGERTTSTSTAPPGPTESTETDTVATVERTLADEGASFAPLPEAPELSLVQRDGIVDFRRLEVIAPITGSRNEDSPCVIIYWFRGRLGDPDNPSRIFIPDSQIHSFGEWGWGRKGAARDIPNETGRRHFADLKPYEIYGGVMVVLDRRPASADPLRNRASSINSLLEDRWKRVVTGTESFDFSTTDTAGAQSIVDRSLTRLTVEFLDDLPQAVRPEVETESLDFIPGGADVYLDTIAAFWINLPSTEQAAFQADTVKDRSVTAATGSSQYFPRAFLRPPGAHSISAYYWDAVTLSGIMNGTYNRFYSITTTVELAGE